MLRLVSFGTDLERRRLLDNCVVGILGFSQCVPVTGTRLGFARGRTEVGVSVPSAPHPGILRVLPVGVVRVWVRVWVGGASQHHSVNKKKSPDQQRDSGPDSASAAMPRSSSEEAGPALFLQLRFPKLSVIRAHSVH